MERNLITVKEVNLNNNCPECYSTDGLKLTFKQKFIENRFYKSITKDIIETLACTKCETTIYPVRWTDAIEGVYNYQRKALTPKKVTLKLKPLAWVSFIVINLIILLIILLTFFPEVFGSN